MTASVELRFVVLREGIDIHKPIEAGDPVTTYEFAEPWPHMGRRSPLASNGYPGG